MVFWWCAVAALVLGGFIGCSGKAAGPSEGAQQGGAPALAGGGDLASGDGGFAATDAAGGRGGTEGSSHGGASAGETNEQGGSSGLSSGAGGRPIGAGGANTGGARPMPPAAWTCGTVSYADGNTCDCGCGVIDPDCSDEAVESCDSCRELGGCGRGACPSNIDARDNAHCSTPAGWLCPAAGYGDGVCDCGCGALDVDCKSERAEDCASCPLFGCAQNLDCNTIDPDDNSICTSPPETWKCPKESYRDGSCDCGCGFRDPDCTSGDRDACESCDGEGSCSHQPCPGLINADANEACVQPTAPSGWTCWEGDYGSSRSCDCGCGVPDPDCRTSDPASCESCPHSTGRCPESVDPNDTTQPAPVPAGWTCDPALYVDANCYCGCGALDIDCGTQGAEFCQICVGCAQGHCERIDPNDSARCSG